MTNSISTFVPELDVVMNTLALTTPVPNVFATRKTYSLAERFFSCPAAAKLLASERFIKPILIDTQNISGARTDVYPYNSMGAKILIAEEDLQMTQGLSNLAFEIFNAQGTADGLYQQASLGNVGMDSFARQWEENEMAVTQEYFELIKQCGNDWVMSPKELREYTRDENLHPEIHLFVQEVGCHTDFYRQAWIRNCQKIYCEKQPADSRSCETKTTDLCNREMVTSLPDKKRRKFKCERYCKLFPQAHVTVKNDPDVRGIIRENCPELLEKSSHQPIQEEL
jgi:hypothetical protein